MWLNLRRDLDLRKWPDSVMKKRLSLPMTTLLPFRARIWIVAAWLVLALTLSLSPLRADPPVRQVTVTGTAAIKVVPDQMLWSVQVYFRAPSVAEAKAQHDTSLDTALKYIKGLGGAVTDLQTNGIQFDKDLYPGDTIELRRNPYSCATQFTFTLTDFAQYGPIADALAKISGVQVQSVNYDSSKREETEREALKQALLKAHDKAGDLAATAGCFIDKPLSIVEGAAVNYAPMTRMTANVAAYSGSTPAAVPGRLEISATVTATYDLLIK